MNDSEGTVKTAGHGAPQDGVVRHLVCQSQAGAGERAGDVVVVVAQAGGQGPAVQSPCVVQENGPFLDFRPGFAVSGNAPGLQKRTAGPGLFQAAIFIIETQDHGVRGVVPDQRGVAARGLFVEYTLHIQITGLSGQTQAQSRIGLNAFVLELEHIQFQVPFIGNPGIQGGGQEGGAVEPLGGKVAVRVLAEKLFRFAVSDVETQSGAVGEGPVEFAVKTVAVEVAGFPQTVRLPAAGEQVVAQWAGLPGYFGAVVLSGRGAVRSLDAAGGPVGAADGFGDDVDDAAQ